jgi:adenylate cyclase
VVSSVDGVEANEFEALGLYDPASPDARHQLELLEFLVELGASADDLVEYRNELPGLASVVALRGGQSMTLTDAATRSGLAEEQILEFTRAAGFPTPAADDRVFTDSFVMLATGLAAAEALFGKDVVLQLVRVMGAAMARLADAIVSAFLVNIEPGARQADPSCLAVARANAEAAGLLPVVVQALDMLLRQHLIAARRSILGEDADVGYETQHMCVGFVDLVESTAMAQRLSPENWGQRSASLSDSPLKSSRNRAVGW